MAPPSHLRVERSPSRRARRAAHGEPDRQRRRRAGGALRPARLAERDAGAAGDRRRRGRRAAIATGAELYFKSVPSRGGSYWKFDDAARFELWADRPRPRSARSWCAPGPSTTTACATSIACAAGPTRPPRALLRRVQPARAHARGDARDIGRAGPTSTRRPIPTTGSTSPASAAASRSCTAPTPATASSSPTRPTTSRRRSCGCPTSPGRSTARARRRPRRPCRPAAARPRRRLRPRRRSLMELGLDGKVAFVTGATRGIGRAIALRLADEGCAVGLCARDADAVAAGGRRSCARSAWRRTAWPPTSPTRPR